MTNPKMNGLVFWDANPAYSLASTKARVQNDGVDEVNDVRIRYVLLEVLLT